MMRLFVFVVSAQLHYEYRPGNNSHKKTAVVFKSDELMSQKQKK